MNNDNTSDSNQANPDPIDISNEKWKSVLSPEIYHVAREKGTERPGSGKYYRHTGVGIYNCAVCGNPLFKSDGKFNSSCGWPSFFEPIDKGSLLFLPDHTFGMKRTEVKCGRCKSHLGHVFQDGPPPTGLRYCINSVILVFDPEK